MTLPPCPPAGRVVHAVPGRTRLRFERGQEPRARAFASHLASHPLVNRVAWRAENRSLTVHHDPARSFAVERATARLGGDRQVLAAREIDWGRVAFACLLSALPVGPVLGVAMTALGAIAEEQAVTGRGPRGGA